MSVTQGKITFSQGSHTRRRCEDYGEENLDIGGRDDWREGGLNGCMSLPEAVSSLGLVSLDRRAFLLLSYSSFSSSQPLPTSPPSHSNQSLI